jgi:hypothetical protein
MIVRPENLEHHEMQLYRTVAAFLDDRLQESGTVEWALRLTSRDRPQIAAVAASLGSPRVRKLAAPWKEAWELIEESWAHPIVRDHDFLEHRIEARIRAGERGSGLIAAIVDGLATKLELSSISRLEQQFRTVPRSPKRVSDLFSVGLRGGPVLDPEKLGLGRISETEFVYELATALDISVLSSLAQARRLGWKDFRSLWRLGGLNRVYFVGANDRAAGDHEPDEFSHGIAGSVKLLHATVQRLLALDNEGAKTLLQRWKRLDDPVHTRLWASFALNAAPPNEISEFLSEQPPDVFWNEVRYPEVAELRAKAFTHLSPDQKQALCSRIKRGPPRKMWSSNVPREERATYQTTMVLREFRRIELAGAELPKAIINWYRQRLREFPEVEQMERVDDGFAGDVRLRTTLPNPDQKFDLLEGTERLTALERALASSRVSWEDNPSERASDWIRATSNVDEVFKDFRSAQRPGDFPKVWERFGWAHGVRKDVGEAASKSEAQQVAELIKALPEATISEAIQGLTWWFSVWSHHLDLKKETLPIWRKIWPSAVRATNGGADEDYDVEQTLETAAQAEDERELDTLNNPVGRLVGVFLDSCPNLRRDKHPFRPRSALSVMRASIIGATGKAKLIAMHRLLEGLPYFLKADPEWTKANLVAPLEGENKRALVLWQAIARRTRFADTLRVIGRQMVLRANDRRLSRTTRQSLVFSLVVECLHALKNGRRPMISYQSVQQVLRSIEDEVRAHAANVLQKFLREVSADDGQTKEQLFDSAIAPFLKDVWPQERSLATPGVAQALADLPATTGARFAQGVDAVKRFLVPFDAWSSMEYGLFGDSGDEPKLDLVNSEQAATALLELLDATIGTAEGSVVPYDLSPMLDHIHKLAPRCANMPAFRRLTTAARA